MAGEWFQMDCGLDSKPEVVEIHLATGEPIHGVCGALCRFWGWAQLNACEDGTMAATPASVAFRCGGSEDLWLAIEAVGWVKFEDGKVCVPGWEKRFTKAAKRRAVDAQRKADARKGGKAPGKCPQSVRSHADKCPQSVRNDADRMRTTADGLRTDCGQVLQNATDSTNLGGVSASLRTDCGLEENRINKNISPPPSSSQNAKSNGGDSLNGDGGGLGKLADGQPGDPLGTSPEVIQTTWDRFVVAWNANPHTANWKQLRTPSDWVARCSDPAWLKDAKAALDIIGTGALRYFKRPIELPLFLKDYVVGKILDGGYREAIVERDRFGKEVKPAPPASSRRFWRAQFDRAMTEAEYQEAVLENKQEAQR